MGTRLVGIALVLLSVGPVAAAATERKGLRLLDHLPRDPLFASLATEDDLPGALDRWLGWIQRLGNGEVDPQQGIAEFESKLGCSLRQDLLSPIGPEIGLVIDLPPIDSLVAGMSNPATGIPLALGRIGILAQTRDAQALDGCLRRLFTLSSEVTLRDTQGLVEVVLPLDAAEGLSASLFYGFREKRFALGASAEFVSTLLAPRREGERLVDGADFAKVAAHLDAAPENLTYVNLPRLREMVQASALLKGLVAANEDARPVIEMLLEPEFTPMGIGMTSIEVAGGTRTVTVGPSGLSGNTAASGIVASIAIPNLLNAIDRGKQKRTMADMRSAATAIEAYSIDNNVYPGPTAGWVPVTAIESSLAPTYIRVLPATDGWGHPFQLWSDGQHYVIVSPGKDGELESDWSGAEIEKEVTTDFRADIVFSDGTFARWPEVQQE